MKRLILLLAPILLFTSPRALADSKEPERMELIRLSSEFYPDQTYTLGIEIDSKTRSMLALYYLDPYPDASVKYRRFPMQSLSTPQVMIRAKNQYDVVKIGLKGNSLTVMYRQDVRYNQWRSKRFILECDSNLSGCSVLDPETHRYVRSAYITAHRVTFLGLIEKAVGIETILTK